MVFLSIEPYDRKDWAMENALVFAFVVFLGMSYKRLPLSRISYTLIFFFLILHEIGTQGDIWDAHKDMTLASLGALVTMLITMCINLYLQKDFAKQWSESLRIKHLEPLGEDEIIRLLKQKEK
ncbi:MAG: DUF2238 domain-containing protein [Proteobacteria bacterium]|nr:DUF2238 domain-containing protein [Pseudomonadota bacterium]